MKKQLFVFFLAGASAFTACKKDDDDKKASAKLLAKVTVTEGEESTVSTLSYDSSKRLTSIKSEEEELKFTYDNKGNLSKLSNSDEGDKFEVEIAYTEAGAPASAKIKAYEGDVLESELNLTYKIESGKVTEITYKAENTEIGKSKITYTNGNVTKVENTITNDELGDIIGLAPVVTYTYGTKKSPFSGASLKYVIDPFISLNFFAKNEVLTEKWGDETTTYTYTYDADAYPLTQKHGTGDDAVTVKYEYK